MSDPSSFQFKFEVRNGKRYIFDIARRKFVFCTPEEEVRQWLIHHLHYQLGYPIKLIGVERQLTYNNRKKRFDLLIFNNDGNASMLIETKAPEIDLDQAVFDQVSTYNSLIKAKYLCIFNGKKMLVAEWRAESSDYCYLSALPPYQKTSN